MPYASEMVSVLPSEDGADPGLKEMVKESKISLIRKMLKPFKLPELEDLLMATVAEIHRRKENIKSMIEELEEECKRCEKEEDVKEEVKVDEAVLDPIWEKIKKPIDFVPAAPVEPPPWKPLDGTGVCPYTDPMTMTTTTWIDTSTGYYPYKLPYTTTGAGLWLTGSTTDSFGSR